MKARSRHDSEQHQAFMRAGGVIKVLRNAVGGGGVRLFFRGTHKVRGELQLSNFVG